MKKDYKTWEHVPESTFKKKTIEISHHGQRIWGIAYIPETNDQRYPLVICAHGLGADYTSCLDYAELLARHKIATYCFDFRGGGGRHSDGDVLKMSLMSEVDDLSSVVAAAKTWDFVDETKILLLGESQGGAASAVLAARQPDDIKGLMLLYPAFLIHDAVHELFDSVDDIPDSYFFKWITLGKAYAVDVWDYDIYKDIKHYEKPVLLLHGDQDGIVPIEYADRAAKTYLDVDYYIIKGGGHGFYGQYYNESTLYILNYLQQLECL